MVLGGTAAGSAAVPAAELYIPWAGGFTSTGQPAVGRDLSAASPAGADGMLLVAGGKDAAGALLDSGEVYGFATVKTDKADYVPGDTVTITGGGWEAGDSVQFTLHETNNPDPHPDRVWFVTADASGNLFDNSFYPEAHDLGVRFYLTASGARSQAQATFTDAKALTVNFAGVGSGSVTGGIAPTTTEFSCTDSAGAASGTCSHEYNNNNVITLTASAAAGSTLGTWAVSGGGGVALRSNCTEGSAACDVTMGTTAATVTLTINAPPTVSSINRANADPTNAASVSWTVTFSESVTGVDSTDFTLAASGVAGASITGVSGGPASYTVTASTGAGSGSLGLNLVDDDSIQDAGARTLGGTGTGNGNFTGQVYTIDKTGPSISSVTGPGNATYGLGQNLDFTVNYNENVTVTGTPTIPLTIGLTARNANYVSGSGSTALLFRYTVVGGDNDSDGIASASPISGTIKDAAGNSAPLAFTPPITTGVLVDTTAPTISSVTGPANGSYRATQNLDFTVNYSENVIVTGTPTIGLTIGSTGRSASYQSGSGSSVLVFRYTVVAPDTDTDGIASASPIALSGGSTMKDAAGNDAVRTFTPPITTGVLVDTTAPTISSVTGPANGSYGLGQNLDFTVNYSENVTVTGTPTFGLTIGSTARNASYLSGSGSSALVFRYTVVAPDTDTDGIASASPIALNSGTMQDAAGNDAVRTFTPPITSAVLVDTTAPSVTSINRQNPSGATTNASSVTFRVTFSESVSGVDTGDFSLTTTSTAAGTIASVSAGSGTTIDVTVNSITGDGTLRLDLKSSGTGIKDTAGNDISGGFTTGQTYTIDRTPPDPPSIPDLDAASDTGTSDIDNITKDNTPMFKGTAEANSTVELFHGGTTSLGTTPADGSGNWSKTVAVLADGTYSITAKATDVAGNASDASGALSVTIDTTVAAPSTPDLDAASDSGSSSTDNITNVKKPKFNGTAEKDASVELFRGGVSMAPATAADGSGNWSFTTPADITPDGTYSITAKQTDVAGNVSAASSALSITIDTQAPNAPTGLNLSPSDDTGTSSADNLTNKTTDLSFRGNAEPDSTVELFDGSASGSANSGSGNWNITAHGPFSEGPHTFTAKATDAAGNTSVASAGLTVTIDITKPNVTINQTVGQDDPAHVGPIHFTVIFINESPAGTFVTGDVSFAGSTAPGTLVGTVTGGPTTFDVSVSGMTGAGNVVASIPAGVAADAAGNANNASSSTDNTVTYSPDNTPPLVTVSFEAVDGQNGWHIHSAVTGTVTANDSTTGNSNVTAISCLDGVNPLVVGSPSGIGTPSASGSLSVSGEGSHNVSCTATDSAGNTGASAGSTTMPVVVKIDTQAPTGVAGAAARPPDHNGWYMSPVNIDFNGTDTNSGIASCTSTGYSGPDNASASVSGHCTDAAGNASADATFGLKYDATGPTGVALTVTAGTAGANGWYTSDVTVHTDGSDDVSGPASCTADQHQSTETAGAVFNGSCTNDTGLTTNAAPLTVKLDKTGPTNVHLTPSGTLGLNGWYTSNVDITTSGDENISAPASCTAVQHLTTDTTGSEFNGSCTNDAGLETHAAPITVKRDATPPNVAITPDRPADHNGWYNDAVTFTNPGTDATSGIASCTTPADYSTPDSGSASVSASCTDNAGNVGNGSFGFKYDATKPANLHGAPNRVPDHGSWYNHAVDVVFTGSDATSGIDSCSTVNYSTPDGAARTVDGRCTDNAGNVSDPVASSAFDYDATPPTIIPSINPASPASTGWYNLSTGAPTVSFTCSDATSGLAGPCPGATTLTDGANQSVSHTISDQAGNSATGTISGIYVDLTPPAIAAGVSPLSAPTGWYNIATGSPTVSFICSDSLSGLASGACPPPVTLGEGANQAVSGVVTDIAGNTGGPATVSGLNVDLTRPSSTITFPAVAFYSNSLWNAGCSTAAGDTCGNGTDNVSGLAKVEVSLMGTNGKYWSGGAFDSGETFLPVTLAAPNATSTGWSQAFAFTNFQSLPPGFYIAHTRATDAAGNGETPGPTVNFTIALNAATIQVISASHTVTSGSKTPGVLKEALALTLEVYDKATISPLDPRNFLTIYEGAWTNLAGLAPPKAAISGPQNVTQGGGPAYLYTITVPAATAANTSAFGTSGAYVVIGKGTFSGATVYTGSPTDPLATGSITQKYLQVVMNGAGKIEPAKTTAVPGSLLLIVEPEYMEFTSDTELFPIVYESVDGDWSSVVQADVPEGFVANPGALSADVTTSSIDAVQFTVKDVGSSWTSTRVTHHLKHKGKDITVTTDHPMVNKQRRKK